VFNAKDRITIHIFRGMKPQTSSTPAGATTTVGSSSTCVRHATPLKAIWLWWTIAPILLSLISFNVFYVHQHYDRLAIVGTVLSTVTSDYKLFINSRVSRSSGLTAAAVVDDVHAPVHDLAKQHLLQPHANVLNTYSMLLNNVKLQRTSSSSNIMLNNARMTNSKKASYSSSRNQQHDNIDSPLVELSFKLSDVDKYVPRIAALKDGMQHELWASEPFLKVMNVYIYCYSS